MPIDLIQRAAERLKAKSDLSLVEKAAAKLKASQTDEYQTGAGQAGAAQTGAAQMGASQQPASVPAAGVGPVASTGAATVPMVDAADVEASRPEATRVDVQRSHSRQVNLDITKLQISGFVTPSGTRTRIAEEFRVIKRPLLLKALATGSDAIEHGNMILVTSASPNEGKTFTAINLALSIASERDLHVLLVDADVQRPSILKTLGLPEEKGLLDVLSDTGMDLSTAIMRTNIKNFSLMAAGSPSLATTELLASQKMANLMDDMAARYRDRIIILDAPPVLASSEPSVLALHVGQVVVVVEAGRTGRRAIEETLSHISGCPNVSMVLNKMEIQAKSDRFGAYSYYETERSA